MKVFTQKINNTNEFGYDNFNKNYAYIKHLINKKYTVYITLHSLGKSLYLDSGIPKLNPTLESSTNYWILEDTGDNNGTVYIKSFNDNLYLTDNINFQTIRDFYLPWPYKTDVNRISFLAQTEDNKYQQKWKLVDSDNNDNNNSVYILSWRNWVLTGFPSNNLFEDFLK